MKIELVSKQVHLFGGKVRRKGEKIFATEREARLLKALGRAAPTEAAPEPVEEAKPKRAYKRKDMQAETLETVAAVAAVAPVLEAKGAEPTSLLDEVKRVKDNFRAQFSPFAAPRTGNDTGTTLHITRPKKSAE